MTPAERFKADQPTDRLYAMARSGRFADVAALHDCARAEGWDGVCGPVLDEQLDEICSRAALRRLERRR